MAGDLIITGTMHGKTEGASRASQFCGPVSASLAQFGLTFGGDVSAASNGDVIRSEFGDVLGRIEIEFLQ